MNESQSAETQTTSRSRVYWVDRLSPFLVGGGFFILMLLLHPFAQYFEFDPDEGNNVIKSLLLAKGYSMYSEIWSDQAPLFTWLLRGWLGLFGWDVVTARVFVLLCSAITVGGVYQTVRMIFGHPHALAAVILLILSPAYIIVSVSVMIGLPALMFSVLSMMGLVSWAKYGRTRCLLFSAVFLVLSAMTKMFVAFLFPIFGIAVLCIAWRRYQSSEGGWGWMLKPALLWGGFVSVTGIVLFLAMVGPSGLDMLVSPHVEARNVYSENVRASIDYRLGLSNEAEEDSIVSSGEVLGLAVIGLLTLILRKKWLLLIPAAWFVAAYVVLRIHAPVWYHHVPLLMIPGCMLAGVAVGEILSMIQSWRENRKAVERNMPLLAGRSLLALLSTILVVIVVLQFKPRLKYSNQIGGMVARGPRDTFLTEMLRQLSDKTDMCFADRQMYAFQTGLPVPPELSVTSHKRFRSNSLSDEDVVKALEKANPGVICLDGWRMNMSRPLWGFLRDNYRSIYRDEVESRGKRNGVFVRKDIPINEREVIKTAYDNTGYPGGGEVLALSLLPDESEEALSILRKLNSDHPERSRTSMLFAETLLAEGESEKGFRVYQSMLKDMQKAKRLSPEPALFYAWRLATWPEANYRNPDLANRIAKSFAKSKSYGYRAALIVAAAMGAEGDYTGAASLANQVLKKTSLASEKTLAKQMIEKYDQQKLYLQPGQYPTR